MTPPKRYRTTRVVGFVLLWAGCSGALWACERDKSGAGGLGGLRRAPESVCEIDATTTLDTSPRLDTSSPIRTDGKFVYYVNSSYALSRVSVNGGAPEGLQGGVSAFDLVAGRLFYGTGEGDVGEVIGVGKVTVFLAGHTPTAMSATTDTLFWTGGISNQSLYELPLFGHSPVAGVRRSAYVSDVKTSKHAVYWRERVANGSYLDRIVRGSLDGQGPIVVVDDIGGLNQFDVNEDWLVLSTTTGLSVGPATGGARTEIVAGNGILDVVIDGDQIYFSRTDACVTDPEVGNGGPICRGNIFRVAMTGGVPERVVATPGAPVHFALDAACVYWAEISDNCHPSCSGALRAAPR